MMYPLLLDDGDASEIDQEVVEAFLRRFEIDPATFDRPN